MCVFWDLVPHGTTQYHAIKGVGLGVRGAAPGKTFERGAPSRSELHYGTQRRELGRLVPWQVGRAPLGGPSPLPLNAHARMYAH